MSKNQRMSTSHKRIYQAARYAILAMVVLTVMNVVLYFLDSDSYYVSSVFSSFFLAVAFENAVGILIGAAILVPFVLAFIFSKNKPVWLIIALVLTALDLLFLIIIGLISEALLYSILDLLAHAAVIVLLVMGIIHGKKATSDAQPIQTTDAAAEAGTQPIQTTVAAANTDPQRAVQDRQEGPFTDVLCSVSVSLDGQKHTIEMAGVARFYENELALGMNNMAQSFLLGSAFAATDEKLRFAYTDISRVYYARKNGRTVRINLNDGRYAFLITTKSAGEQVAELFAAHGITIEPFAS